MTSVIALLEDNIGSKNISTIINRFGCMFCHDKATPLCDNYHLDTQEFDMPTEGTCDRKIMRFVALIPHYDKPPTITRVILDHSKAMAHKCLERVYVHVDDLEKEKRKLTSSDGFVDTDQLKNIQISLNQSKAELLNLLKQVTHYEDLQEGRNTPKKIEVERTYKATPVDVAHMIREANQRALDHKEDKQDGDDGKA